MCHRVFWVRKDGEGRTESEEGNLYTLKGYYHVAIGGYGKTYDEGHRGYRKGRGLGGVVDIVRTSWTF